MAIVLPDGRVLSYPKPMTLSLHTMSAVNDAALPFADRVMLAIRSRVHSKQGRSIGHALGRLPLPIVTINAIVQLLVPPPKYHVTSLVDCDITDEAPLDSVILMERGDPAAEDGVALRRPWTSCWPTRRTRTRSRHSAGSRRTWSSTGWASMPCGRANGSSCARPSRMLGGCGVRVAGHEWAQVIPDLLRSRDAATPAPASSPARLKTAVG